MSQAQCLVFRHHCNKILFGTWNESAIFEGQPRKYFAFAGELARIFEMAERGSYPEVHKNLEQHQELSKLLASVRSSIKQSLPYIEKNNLE